MPARPVQAVQSVPGSVAVHAGGGGRWPQKAGSTPKPATK